MIAAVVFDAEFLGLKRIWCSHSLFEAVPVAAVAVNVAEGVGAERHGLVGVAHQHRLPGFVGVLLLTSCVSVFAKPLVDNQAMGACVPMQVVAHAFSCFQVCLSLVVEQPQP